MFQWQVLNISRICKLGPEKKNIGTSSALVTVILLYWILEYFDPVSRPVVTGCSFRLFGKVLCPTRGAQISQNSRILRLVGARRMA